MALPLGQRWAQIGGLALAWVLISMGTGRAAAAFSEVPGVEAFAGTDSNAFVD